MIARSIVNHISWFYIDIYTYIQFKYVYYLSFTNISRSDQIKRLFLQNCLSCFRWIDEDDHVPLFFPILSHHRVCILFIFCYMSDHWRWLRVYYILSRCNCYWNVKGKHTPYHPRISPFFFLSMIPFFVFAQQDCPFILKLTKDCGQPTFSLWLHTFPLTLHYNHKNIIYYSSIFSNDANVYPLWHWPYWIIFSLRWNINKWFVRVFFFPPGSFLLVVSSMCTFFMQII